MSKEQPGRKKENLMSEVKWCWLESKYADEAYGPFDTKEEAIAHAKERMQLDNFGPVPLDGVKIRVGHCKFADPSHYLPDIDEIMERIDERAADNEYGFYDDQIFNIKKGAGEALKKALEDWAQEYITTVVWCSTNEVEEEIL